MKDHINIENQYLKELLEIAKQITSYLDIKLIIKNVSYFIKSKFDVDYCSFILPDNNDENNYIEYYYKNTTFIKEEIANCSIKDLILFLSQQEYNQISTEQLISYFHDNNIIKFLKDKNIEFLVPMKTNKGINGIYIQSYRKNSTQYSMEEIQFIVNLISFASISIDNSNLYRKATTDRMTNLFNHHQFQKVLEDYINNYKNKNTTFSLMIFDIDHFKKFNDNYGHLEGDYIIKQIARLIQNSIREQDFAARYGGEEFVIILPDTNIEKAKIFAERLRKTIEDFDFINNNISHKVTISIGIAEFDVKNILCNQDLISLADKALYYSKQNGRNRVSIYNNLTNKIE